MRKLALAALMSLTVLFLVPACSTKAYGSQCGYVIGNGTGDSHQIKRVFHPNEVVPDQGDDITQFVPCNGRNFLITPPEKTGDRHDPAFGRTRGSGATPALPVKAYLRMFWTLNQDDKAMRAFQPFCEKYGCYTTDGDKVTGNANYSSAGWNGMLRENHSLVIDNVFSDAIAKRDPGIWRTRADWHLVADDMSAAFAAEMRKSDGASVDFFCGQWTKEACTPVRFVIDSIAPVDAAVANIDQQTSLAAQQKALNDAQSRATATRYGPLANYWNGLLDVIAACKSAGQTCTVIVGKPDGVNIAPRSGK